jgi:hypothetical protein
LAMAATCRNCPLNSSCLTSPPGVTPSNWHLFQSLKVVISGIHFCADEKVYLWCKITD